MERSERSRRGSRGLADRPYAVAAAVVLVLLLAGGAWLWLRSGEEGDPSAGTPGAADTAAAPAAPADTAAELPPPDSADPLIRELAGELSSHPRLAEWLVTENLARRFVGAVVTVGSGLSPRSELEFLDPEGAFRVRRAEGDTVIAPSSYDRYDPIVEAFVSLDTEGTARLYRRLRPLFQRVYRDLGFPEGDFDAAMARAVETLLAVPVPDGPVEVEPDGATAWAYRDPDLEGLDPAQKHLLRMGPENVRRVQEKLRELSGAMDLPTLPVSDGEDAGP